MGGCHHCFLLDTQMGHAAAEAAVRAGLTLVPFSYGGDKEDGKQIDVNGVTVTIVSQQKKLEILKHVRNRECDCRRLMHA